MPARCLARWGIHPIGSQQWLGYLLQHHRAAEPHSHRFGLTNFLNGFGAQAHWAAPDKGNCYAKHFQEIDFGSHVGC